jgi:hypothetical protein
VKPTWHEIVAAYEEAAEHLERAAMEPIDEGDKAAFRLVAKRIRAAGDRVKPF